MTLRLALRAWLRRARSHRRSEWAPASACGPASACARASAWRPATDRRPAHRRPAPLVRSVGLDRNRVPGRARRDDAAGSAPGSEPSDAQASTIRPGAPAIAMRDRGTCLRRKAAHDLREPRDLPVEPSRQPVRVAALGHRLLVGIVDRAGERRRARDVASLDELAELTDPFREGVDRELVVVFVGEHVEPHLLDACASAGRGRRRESPRRRPPSRRSRSPPARSSRRDMPARARPSATAVAVRSDRCRASGRRID